MVTGPRMQLARVSSRCGAGDGFIEEAMPSSIIYRLNRVSRAAPVSRLRLGKVAEDLTNAGLTTLESLLVRIEVEPRGLQGILGINRMAAACISRSLEALSAAVNDEGNIDWDRFDAGDAGASIAPDTAPRMSQEGAVRAPVVHCPEECEANVVPLEKVVDGKGFIDSFPEVIEAIIRTRKHEADRLILTERLTRHPHERRTLEQVAAAAPGSVTRERIRQRETRILERLAGALLYDRADRLGLAFRGSFVGYWKKAAEWFGRREQVSYTEFIQGLQEAWDVPAERIFVHLPLIFSVLTKKATLPERMRERMRLGPRVYRSLDESIRQLPLTRLALGKSAGEIMAFGVETIGDLIAIVRSGSGPEPRTRAGKTIAHTVAGLTEAIADDGSVDWTRYAQVTGLMCLPEGDPSTAEEFLENLPSDMEMVVEANAIGAHAVQIFRMRIAVPRASRLTLARAAEILGTHGPSIKRVESLMLGMLNDQLIDRDLTRSKVMYQPRFLEFWGEAALVHRQCNGEFAVFRELLSKQWGVLWPQFDRGFEVLWSVLNEYPGGRPSAKRAKSGRPALGGSQPSPDGMIVLRGFRRVH